MEEYQTCNLEVISSSLISCSSLLSSIACGRVASFPGFSPKKTLILSDTIPTPIIGLDKVNECVKVCLAIRQQGTELTPFSSLPCIEVLDRRFGCGFESRPARSDKKTLLQIAGSSTKVEQIACLFYCSSNSAVRVGVLYTSGQWFNSILEHQFLSNHERKKNVSIY